MVVEAPDLHWRRAFDVSPIIAAYVCQPQWIPIRQFYESIHPATPLKRRFDSIRVVTIQQVKRIRPKAHDIFDPLKKKRKDA